MFSANIYIKRRNKLKQQIDSGMLLFMGNVDSPMNYAGNQYTFRQDSSFLYFFGIDEPGLAAIIDIDNDREILFGDDLTIDDIIWMGNLPTTTEKAEKVGIQKTLAVSKLKDETVAAKNKNQTIHYLPPYRAETARTIASLLDIHPEKVKANASVDLIKAVVAQRNIKSAEEIEQIEIAVNISREMHIAAMKNVRPGMLEQEIAGAVEGIALAAGSRLSFPIIYTIHGETLHNHYHGNKMKAGQLAVNDSGAESPMHYAGDITRTMPVSGKFTSKQKDIYEICLKSQLAAIDAIKPEIKYRDIHLQTCRIIASGLKEIGLMKGDINAAVEQGAHALFMPHGLGHMLGLDVHDMENLGEDYVGYDDETKRSDQFGLAYLRMGKRLKPGHVITVEPGIYFISQLIDLWQSQGLHTDYINYDKVAEYHDFGGIRIEDDVVVTNNSHQILGEAIPKSVDELESIK